MRQYILINLGDLDKNFQTYINYLLNSDFEINKNFYPLVLCCKEELQYTIKTMGANIKVNEILSFKDYYIKENYIDSKDCINVIFQDQSDDLSLKNPYAFYETSVRIMRHTNIIKCLVNFPVDKRIFEIENCQFANEKELFCFCNNTISFEVDEMKIGHTRNLFYVLRDNEVEYQDLYIILKRISTYQKMFNLNFPIKIEHNNLVLTKTIQKAKQILQDDGYDIDLTRKYKRCLILRFLKGGAEGRKDFEYMQKQYKIYVLCGVPFLNFFVDLGASFKKNKSSMELMIKKILDYKDNHIQYFTKF